MPMNKLVSTFALETHEITYETSFCALFTKRIWTREQHTKRCFFEILTKRGFTEHDFVAHLTSFHKTSSRFTKRVLTCEKLTKRVRIREPRTQKIVLLFSILKSQDQIPSMNRRLYFQSENYPPTKKSVDQKYLLATACCWFKKFHYSVRAEVISWFMKMFERSFSTRMYKMPFL